MKIIGVLLIIGLALVHIFASRSEWLAKIPRRWWISFAGGVSTAYIFLRIFPELSEAQEAVEHDVSFLMTYLEHHVYLLALIGLALFYFLEKVAHHSRQRNHTTTGDDSTETGVFWLHIVSFAIYNAILGYLLRESEHNGLIACLVLFFALALHFAVNDIGLREHHQKPYDQFGRWILAAAILIGGIVGETLHFSEAAVAVIWAPIAGGTILNVLKEELPTERDSHFGVFAAGAAVYSAILLAL